MVQGPAAPLAPPHGRLTVCYERLTKMHLVFLTLACTLICGKQLRHRFCWPRPLTQWGMLPNRPHQLRYQRTRRCEACR